MSHKGPRRTKYPLKLDAGHHVGETPVPVLRLTFGIKLCQARGKNNGTNLEVNDLLLLVQIDCIGTARLLTLPALFLVEIETMVLVNGVTGRNSLCIGNIDTLNRIQPQIVVVPNLYRAVISAVSTGSTFFLNDVPGLFAKPNGKRTRFSVNPFYLSVGNNLYITMSARLNEFGRQYSEGTVIGGKGFVKLGHLATNSRRRLHQVNAVAQLCKVER